MLIAQQKQQENIAEYILYMYQVEDVIRAYDFDVDRLMTEFIEPQLNNASFIGQYKSWYDGLIRQMKLQRIEKAGHLTELKDVLIELTFLHNTLISLTNDTKYKDLFELALPNINEFKERSNLKDKNDVEVIFHALYMKLLLRIQKKEISAATEEAFDSMRILLAYLAKSYHRMKRGDLDFLKN